MSSNAHARDIVVAFYARCNAGYGIVTVLTIDQKISALTIAKPARYDLAPDTGSYQGILAQPHLIDENDPLFSDTQPRLQFVLEQLLHMRASSSFMPTRAPEEPEYLSLIADAARTL